jgi:hypothetical protein
MLPPETLGEARYQLDGELGRGGMSTVWRAWDVRLSVWRAIKSLPPAASRPRFEREGRAMARLRHPHVLTVHDVIEQDGQLFLVMDLAEGGSLEAWVRRHGPMSPITSARLVAMAADALDHAHRQRIVHRDVKPANLLLHRDGTLVLGDFGLARIEAEDTLTRVGAGFGTPAFVSPEQRRDAGSVDGRADLYSLGATLFWLVTDLLPWDLDRQGPQDWLSLGIPEEMGQVISKATRFLPQDRYPTAAELAQALRALAARLPVPDQEPPLVEEGTLPPPLGSPTGETWAPLSVGTRPRRRWALGLGALAVLGALIWAVPPQEPESEPMSWRWREMGFVPIEPSSAAMGPHGDSLTWQTPQGDHAEYDLRDGTVRRVTEPASTLASHFVFDWEEGDRGLVSPDGNLLAVVRRSGRVEVVDGAGRAQGALSLQGAPVWSPDSRRLALCVRAPAGVWVADLAKGTVVSVTDEPCSSSRGLPVLAWRDERQLMFVSFRDPFRPQLKRVSLEEGQVGPLETLGPLPQDMQWLGFSSSEGLVGLAEWSRSTVCVADASTGAELGCSHWRGSSELGESGPSPLWASGLELERPGWWWEGGASGTSSVRGLYAGSRQGAEVWWEEGPRGLLHGALQEPLALEAAVKEVRCAADRCVALSRRGERLQLLEFDADSRGWRPLAALPWSEPGLLGMGYDGRLVLSDPGGGLYEVGADGALRALLGGERTSAVGQGTTTWYVQLRAARWHLYRLGQPEAVLSRDERILAPRDSPDGLRVAYGTFEPGEPRLLRIEPAILR